jgi:hypothetical protein
LICSLFQFNIDLFEVCFFVFYLLSVHFCNQCVKAAIASSIKSVSVVGFPVVEISNK